VAPQPDLPDASLPRDPREPLARDKTDPLLVGDDAKGAFKGGWVPSVQRSLLLLEGINDLTGRPCRIYLRPGRRVVMVETLS